MGLDISALASNTATVKVDFMGQTINVTYKPSVITLESMEIMDTKPGTDGLFEFLEDAITEWDIFYSGKRKVPPTKVGMAKVPVPVLRKIFTTIMEEASSGEADGTSSDG